MELNHYIEHTNVTNTATEEDIQKLCEEASKYHFASVSVAPIYVSYAKELLKNTNIEVSTVVGFPLGINTKEVKVYEAIDAVSNGADGVEMVVNTAMIKNKQYDYIEEEIEEVRDAIDGKTLKIIIETSLLTQKEIIKMTEICNRTFVHFIVVSTYESENEYKKEDIETIMKHKNEILEVKILANLKTEKQLEELINIGVNKVGSSYSVKIMEG